MADLTKIDAQIRMGMAVECRLIPMIASEAIKRGQPVYRTANGTAALTRANAVATAVPVGIATTDARAGSAFEALYHGRLFGYDLDDVAPGSRVYLSSATPGALADTAPAGAGNVVVAVGSVHTMTDRDGTKFLFVDIPQAGPPPVALS